jgi:integrase
VVRAILALPGPDDDDGKENVAALLAHLSRTGEPLPEPDTVQRRLHAPVTLTAKVTVAQWLDQWLAAKRGRTPKSYEVDVRVHLKPRIGNIRIDRLTVGQLADMFDAIDEENIAREANNTARRDIESRRKAARGRKDKAVLREELHALPPYRRPTGPTTQKNIRACLRAALNKAISHQLMTFNPAAHLDMRDTKKTRPLVWTASRIEFWQQTGRAPGPVMVWTPEHTGAFLDHIAADPLYPLFHLITFRGLRRGEACGARWIDLDEAEETLTIATQLVLDGWDVVEAPPKTKDGNRTIALDAATLSTIRKYRTRQKEHRLAHGANWNDTGRIFTQDDGSWLHPGKVTDHFQRLITDSGLPPVRLHDLRHGAATLAYAAGADTKDIQEMLGHANLNFTSDTYTSVLPQLARANAEATAKIVPRKAQ